MIAGVLIVTVIASLVGVKVHATRAERHTADPRGEASKSDPAGRE